MTPRPIRLTVMIFSSAFTEEMAIANEYITDEAKVKAYFTRQIEAAELVSNSNPQGIWHINVQYAVQDGNQTWSMTGSQLIDNDWEAVKTKIVGKVTP